MASRDYDLVLFGATGFTGSLVARALANSPELHGRRWAIAGRNRQKLEAIASDCGGAEIEVADATDVHSLRALAARTTVIATTVGPYLATGLPLVEACAAAGTHYADLTGEPPFVRESIDVAAPIAKTSGARITHCCGFDSIPSDLGTLLLQNRALQDGAPCDSVVFTLMAASGGFSGGTAHSMLEMFEAASADKKVRKILSDPYSLVPEGNGGADGRDRFDVRLDDEVGGWVGPFLMAAINTRVVRRSNHLLGHRYGSDFRYAEQHRFGRGLGGAATARAVQLGLGAMVGLGATSPGRAVLNVLMPAQGKGPSEASREKGFFVAHLHGHRKSDGAHYKVIVKCPKDPGYAGTAIMMSQAALSLAHDPLGAPGVTTPAAAMGVHLIKRLQAQGMTFEAERLA